MDGHGRLQLDALPALLGPRTRLVALGLAAAVDYLSAIGRERIVRHERELVGYALERMREIAEVRAYGPPDLEERSGVVAFSLGDAHPHDISTILDSEGVAIRAGHHCAQLVMRHFEVAATAHASFYLYNTTEDVDRLVEGLKVVREVFRLPS